MNSKVKKQLKNIYNSLDSFNLGLIGLFVINILILCRFNYVRSLDLFLLSFIILFNTSEKVLTKKHNIFVKLFLNLFVCFLIVSKYLFNDLIHFILIKSVFLFFVYFLYYKNLKRDQLFIVERTYVQFFIWFFIIKFLFINGLSSISSASVFHIDIRSLHLAFNICLALISLLTFSIDITIKLGRKERSNDLEVDKKDEEIVTVEKINTLYCQKDLEVIESNILTFFESESSYLAFDFSLNMLSQYLNIPSATVSYVINNKLNTSFYKLLASYRIKYAKEIILKEEDITFEFISESCGFKSKSTFNKYFLMLVGKSPSEFKNSLK